MPAINFFFNPPQSRPPRFRNGRPWMGVVEVSFCEDVLQHVVQHVVEEYALVIGLFSIAVIRVNNQCLVVLR